MKSVFITIIASVFLWACSPASAPQQQATPEQTAPGDGGPPQLSQMNELENTLYLQLKYGRVVIKLRPDLAPQHAARMKKLTREGFYNGLKFHRVIENFMAQTGDPTGTGTSGSKYPDLRSEFSRVTFTRGIVGMARAGSPHSANSQFFIMFGDANSLNNKYTVVGEVRSGMEFVDKIKRGEPPANPDVIVSMKVAADVK